MNQSQENPRPYAISRRVFVARSSAVAVAAGFAAIRKVRAADNPSPSTNPAGRKFKICLSPGMIGIRADIRESIALATQLGFEAVEPQVGELASMPAESVGELRDELKSKNLLWGAAGMSMPMGRADEEFDAWLPKLADAAAALQRAGATRIGTWITPGDNRLTYLEQFRRLAKRTTDVAKICDDHGLRFGMEYLGPKTMRSRLKFQFIHTMKEMRELIAETGAKNVGLIVDSWHWYNAGETPADVRALRNEEIVWVHLNDAPAGVPVDEQVDNRRALPASTGVIDIGGFLGALIAIGYDGPASAEPFDNGLRRIPREQATKRAIDSIHKALAEVRE